VVRADGTRETGLHKTRRDLSEAADARDDCQIDIGKLFDSSEEASADADMAKSLTNRDGRADESASVNDSRDQSAHVLTPTSKRLR
jgi:hypothetical protein